MAPEAGSDEPQRPDEQPPRPTQRSTVEQVQFAFNTQTADNWEAGARHRENCHGWLTTHAPSLSRQRTRSDAPAGLRLAVVGAGNCNDLDLNSLLEFYTSITLFDLDGTALERGVSRQGLCGDPRIVLRGGVDLTGIAHRWPDPAAGQSSSEWVTPLVRDLTSPEFKAGEWVDEQYDVVASLCVLSQLFIPAVERLRHDDPRLAELVTAIRQHHLQTLLRMTTSPGVVVFVSDFVSSDTCPSLTEWTSDLPALARQLLSQGNFLLGTHPGQVLNVYLELIHSKQCALALSEPKQWLWSLGPRTFLVYGFAAFRFQSGRQDG